METQRQLDTTKVIKLDIDLKSTDYLQGFAFPQLKNVSEILKLTYTKVQVFETKHGYHIYLHMKIPKQICDLYLPCIQSLMGSDYKREALNFTRVLAGEQNWNVLFKEKHKGRKIVSKEIFKRKETNILKEMLKC